MTEVRYYKVTPPPEDPEQYEAAAVVLRGWDEVIESFRSAFTIAELEESVPMQFTIERATREDYEKACENIGEAPEPDHA